MKNEKDVREYVKFYNSEFGRKVLEKELEFVEKRLKGCENVLSIGCGPALLEAELQHLHPEMRIIGLDSSKEMLKQAPSSLHVEYGDAQRLKFDDNSFDAVLYVTSLEFIKDYEKAIKEGRRVLKNKGKILVLMLNPGSHYFKEKYSDKSSYIRRNIKHLDIYEIREVVSRCFFIENEEYYLGIKDGKVLDTHDPDVASLYIIEGVKHDE